MPIAMGVIDACKLKYNSKGSAFIALIAFAMCLLPGTGWLTGSLSGPIMVGFLPAELKHLATFDSWFKILALPWFIVTVVYVALVVVLMKPKEAIGIPRDTFKEEYRALGPVSRQEIITGIILIACLVLFSTKNTWYTCARGGVISADFTAPVRHNQTSGDRYRRQLGRNSILWRNDQPFVNFS